MYALVDCNNFYVSCERAFQPHLVGRPVVVLSNNDGCIISRSQEAKDLGLRMGDPLFKVRPLLLQHGVHVLSSNYALYGDMSQRVMRYLTAEAPAVEVYSIDEAFLDLHGLERYHGPLEPFVRGIRAEVRRRTHIPTCVGVAPTKTLAKLANRLAKHTPGADGVLLLDTPARQQWALTHTPVAEVWGVGRQYAPQLQAQGIHTAADLARCSEVWARKHLGGVVGARLVRELQGRPCHQLQPSEDGTLARRHSLACTRTFGRPLAHPDHLRAAVAAFVSRAAEKLRRQGSVAHLLTVFISQNRFGPAPPPHSYSAQLTLPTGTSSTLELAQAARYLLDQLWQPGRHYVKAGVILAGFEGAGAEQLTLFDAPALAHRPAPAAPRPQAAALMQRLDQLNARYGRGSVQLAAAFTPKGQSPPPWHGQQNHRTRACTTSWEELWEIG